MPSSANIAGTGSTDTLIGAPTASWSNSGNITANDGSVASCTVSGGDITHGLLATNFGFAIPSGATIDGVVASFDRRVTFGTALDSSVRLIKAGSYAGTDKSAGALWPLSFTLDDFGGVSDLWGTTLTDTDVNASNFGVMIQAIDDSGISSTIEVDYVQITVYYTEGGNTASLTKTLTSPSLASTATVEVTANLSESLGVMTLFSRLNETGPSTLARCPLISTPLLGALIQ